MSAERKIARDLQEAEARQRSYWLLCCRRSKEYAEALGLSSPSSQIEELRLEHLLHGRVIRVDTSYGRVVLYLTMVCGRVYGANWTPLWLAECDKPEHTHRCGGGTALLTWVDEDVHREVLAHLRNDDWEWASSD